jgi:hypothetical protein
MEQGDIPLRYEPEIKAPKPERAPQAPAETKIEVEKTLKGFKNLRSSPRTDAAGKPLGPIARVTAHFTRQGGNKAGKLAGEADVITGTTHAGNVSYAGLEKPFLKSYKAFTKSLPDNLKGRDKATMHRLEKILRGREGSKKGVSLYDEFITEGMKKSPQPSRMRHYRELLFDAQPGQNKGTPFEHSPEHMHLWSDEPHRMNMAKYLKTGKAEHLGYRSIRLDSITKLLDPDTGISYPVGKTVPIRPAQGLQKPPDPADIQRALESIEGPPGGASRQIPTPGPQEPIAPPPGATPPPTGTGLQTAGPGLQPRAPIPDYLDKKGFEWSEYGPWTRAAKQRKRGFHPVLRAFGGGVLPRLGAFGALGGIGYSIGGTPGAVLGGGLALGGGKALSKLAMAAERFAGRRMKGLGHFIVDNEQFLATLAEGAMLPQNLRPLVQGALNMKARGPTAWRAAAYTLSHHPDFRTFIANQIGEEE